VHPSPAAAVPPPPTSRSARRRERTRVVQEKRRTQRTRDEANLGELLVIIHFLRVELQEGTVARRRKNEQT